jgi:hypothetical protein
VVIVLSGCERQLHGEGPQFVGIPQQREPNGNTREEAPVNVGEMQRKLSRWAEQDKNKQFYGLFDLLCDKDWLRLAHDHESL